MIYDSDRLALLSGISPASEGLLNEASKMEASDVEEADDAEEGGEEKNEMKMESRLRDMIRGEIAAVLREMQEEKDLQAIQAARQAKSVGAALGFHGFGFESRKSKNKAAAHGVGRSRGFGGPGFM